MSGCLVTNESRAVVPSVLKDTTAMLRKEEAAVVVAGKERKVRRPLPPLENILSA